MDNLEAIYEQNTSVAPVQQGQQKPTFFSLIADEFHVRGYSCDAESRCSWLLPMLRCICDSYYNLVLIHHGNLQQLPDFPEFVYDFNTQMHYNQETLRAEPKIQNPTASNCEFYA